MAADESVVHRGASAEHKITHPKRQTVCFRGQDGVWVLWHCEEPGFPEALLGVGPPIAAVPVLSAEDSHRDDS